MFSLIFFFLSLILLLVTSFTDLKDRIIPNTITLPFIVIGFFLHAIQSIQLTSFTPIINSVSAALIAFVFAFILYSFGVWAGGDVKLFTAIAALNPINLMFFKEFFPLPEFFKVINLPIFSINLFILSAFMALPFGMILTLNALRTDENLRLEIKNQLKSRLFKLINLSALITIIYFINSLFQINYFILILFFLFVSIIFFKLPKKIQLIALFFLVFSIVFFGLINQLIFLFISLTIFYVLFDFFIKSKKLFRIKKKITSLKEGEIPGELIYLKNGIPKKEKEMTLKSLLNFILKGKKNKLKNFFRKKENILANPRRARGLNEIELKKLKELVKLKKLKNELEIKLSSPFVPAIFLAYLLANFIGDFILLLIL